MQDLVTRYLRKFKKEHRMRRRLGGVLLVLALMVSIGVYWQLKLTGAALTNETYCGKEEHTHDAEECYEWVLICGYDDANESEVTVEELEALWEAGLIGTEDADSSAEVVETDAATGAVEAGTEAGTEMPSTDEAAETGASTEVESSEESAAGAVSTAAEVSDGSASAGHTHTTECYETVTTLVCELEDTEDMTVTTEGHTHDDSCYTAVLTCGQEEGEGHTHSDSCYVTGQVLSCGLEESEGHTHSEDCYDEEGNLICGLEESEGHTHSDSCYTEVETLVCGLEESEGHTHDASCYTTELACGLEESETVTETIEGHTHDESCYVTEQVLICGLEDTEGEPEMTESETADDANGTVATEDGNDSDNTEDPAGDAAENNDGASEEGTSEDNAAGSETGHVHTAACYQKVLVCELEEHTHTAACLSDNTADVETAEDWEATLPSDLSEDWAEAVVAIAESQLGYTESTANFTLDDDGETQRGYTRYGAWAGNVYGDWDAMFASFCLSYAGLSVEDFPESTGANAWAVKLKELDLFANAADYVPTAGDLVFLDSDEDSKIDRVGIVISVDEENDKLTVIEGDYAVGTDATESGTVDAVCEVEYSLSDACVLGYGVLPEYVSEFKTFTATADGVTVTVTAPTGALPDGAELVVSLIEEGSDAYNEAAKAIGYVEETAEVSATESEDGIALASEEDAETVTETVVTSGLAVLDISFQVDGVEVEPTEAVTVSIDASAIIPEEADASTIEVQHLTETEDGVEATLVADATEETEGTVTVDAETATAVAEFEVESFSTFTIKWSNTDRSITVYVYDTDGNAISGAPTTDVTNLTGAQTLSTLASTYVTADSGYKYSYATVTYTTGQGQNASTMTAKATAVSYSWSNGHGSYSVTLDGETSGTDVDSISAIYLYYVNTNPKVSISATSSAVDGPYTLTAEAENFEGTVSYNWSFTATNASNSALNVSNNNDGTYTVTSGSTTIATITVSGDTCTVTWAVTGTDYKGYTITASVSATNETNTATNSYTVTYSGATTTASTISSLTFDHVDVKVTLAGSGYSNTNYILYKVSSVTVTYDGKSTTATSNKIYSDVGSEWTFFHDNSSSVSFKSAATITIVYTLYNEDTEKQEEYTAVLTSSSTYADGTYYPADGENAYMLYNYLYGTNYSEGTWNSSEHEDIDISGMSIFLVAAILCDGTTASYNSLTKNGIIGLDFALDVATLLQNTANFNMDVKKVFEGSNTIDNGQFEFNLYDVTNSVTVSDSTWIFTLSDATTSKSTSGSSGSNKTTTETVKFDQITYSSVLDSTSSSTTATKTYYYIITETNSEKSGVTYDNTIYGVAVTVETTKTSTGSGSSYIYTTTVKSTTYYKLVESGTSGTYTATTVTASETSGVSESGSETVFTFTNSYSGSTDITILKVDADSTNTTLSGAVFTLTSSSGSIYYKEDGTTETSEVRLTTDSYGKISVTGLSNGTYTLTEVTAPDGYNLLTGSISFTVSSSGITLNGTCEYAEIGGDDSLTIVVTNTAGYVLPSTGGSGTMAFTILGLLLCGGAALLLYRRRTIM